jgi:hypothetical protein
MGQIHAGTQGVRAEFGYPTELIVDSKDQHLIEGLKNYRVPIFIRESIKVQLYGPKEEGYEYR